LSGEERKSAVRSQTDAIDRLRTKSSDVHQSSRLRAAP
jgi:hypothetical protein